MEGSCSRLLDNFIAITLLFLHLHTYLSLHAYCCWFKCSMYLYLLMCSCVHIAIRLFCIGINHLSHTHTTVVVGLLINSSMYICVSVAFALFFSYERY